MEGNIFEKILGQDSLFTDRKAFDHAFEPSRLPHREHEVDALVRNLVDALNGHIPSAIIHVINGRASPAPAPSFRCREWPVPKPGV